MKPIKLHKNYIKKRDKLLKSHVLTKEEIDATLHLFQNDPTDRRLRVHKIRCRRDKQRFSLTVINTQYRILYSSFEDVDLIVYIANHDEYSRLNKNC